MEREKLIKTDYAVTGWMLFIINHSREDVLNNTNRNNRQQLNNFIKTLFSYLFNDEFHYIIDTFWSEYNNFNDKNDHFDSDELFCSIKYIRDSNIHLWYQKYSLPCTKVIGFVACIVTSKMIGMGSAERSWNSVNTN